MSASPSLLDYQLRLAGFEGPLDVLLRMIEERKLEVTTLSLVDVTDGFIAYIDALIDPPAVLLAEFVGMAARLLVLKSRALIPQPPAEEVEEAFVDIARQLEEYRRMREIGEELRRRESAQLRSFGRVAPPLRRFVNTRLELPDVAALRAGFERAIARPQQLSTIAPIAARVSIQDMIERIQRRVLGRRASIRFADAIGESDRSAVVAGFVAVLALWSRRVVELSQGGLFEEIHVSPRRSSSAEVSS